MLKHLLEQWSKTPEPWFSKRHLESLSQKEFRDLEAQRVLLYEIPKDGEETVYEPRCPWGCTLFVESDGDELEAFCPNHSEEGSRQITSDHLNRYRFSIENLSGLLLKANRLQGKMARVGAGVYFGSLKMQSKTIACVIWPHISEKDVFQMHGLTEALYCDGVLVFTPSLDAGLPEISKTVRVAIMSTADALNHASLSLNFQEGLSRLRLESIFDGQTIHNTEPPPLTEKELKAEQKYDYKSSDIIRFTNEIGTHGSRVIEVNGKKVNLSPAQTLLMARFSVQLKRDKKGDVSRAQVAREGITDNSKDGYRTDDFRDARLDDLVLELRNKISGHLHTCGRSDIIEARGNSFRLSMHPGRILAPHKDWLTDTFEEIRASLLSKRAVREKRKNRK